MEVEIFAINLLTKSLFQYSENTLKITILILSTSHRSSDKSEPKINLR